MCERTPNERFCLRSTHSLAEEANRETNGWNGSAACPIKKVGFRLPEGEATLTQSDKWLEWQRGRSCGRRRRPRTEIGSMGTAAEDGVSTGGRRSGLRILTPAR